MFTAASYRQVNRERERFTGFESESAAEGLGVAWEGGRVGRWWESESVLLKTAIFPQKEGRKREISIESARGSSLRARPTSRWAPKAHRMMGKTQWRHRERSFGTNVPVLDKQRDNFPLLSEPLKTDVNKNVVIERFLNWKLCSRTRSCHERDHFSQRDRSLRMGFSLSPMYNSTVSPENSNGRARLGNLENVWLLIQAIHEGT